jgi:hypothetical protein
MKIGLRDKFRTVDFADPGQPLLERIGGLYYRGQRTDQPKVQKQLKGLLNPSAMEDAQETFLCLHAAVLLAQSGNFEGISFILELLKGTLRQDQLRLIRTALRNCSQFPLAIILAQSIDLSEANGHNACLREVMQLSDDDLFAYAEKKDQQAYFENLVQQVDTVLSLPRQPQRDLAFGTIVRRPVRKDFGFRYTGFLAIERPSKLPLIIPYDMGDVLNRNDQHAMQDVWQLLRQPGRRAIAVYDTRPPHEVQQLYVLPFAPRTEREMESLVTELARGAEGLHVGVVVELSVDRYEGYRIITADGLSALEHYLPDRQRIGSCFLIHDLNSQPLSTRFRIPAEEVPDVAERFKKHSQIDRAVHVKTHHKRHTLASRQGKTLFRYGDISDRTVYFVEEAAVEGEMLYFPFEIPGLTWTSEERCQVLSCFFAQRPDALGVLLEVYEYKDSQYACIIHPQSGETLRPRVSEGYPAGNLAFCEMGDDGNLYAHILPGFRIEGGCPHCFGTGYRICEACNGKGRVTCPDCGGTQRVGCTSCHGSGQESCGHCDGTGEREFICRDCDGTGVWEGECRNCGGSGTYRGSCTVCGGTGRYADSGRICKKCGGSGDFTAPCRRCSGRGVVSGTCRRCDGQGRWIGECKTCHGSGRWDCGTCHGRGEIRCTCEYGSVICDVCNGDRVSVCGCQGKERGSIVSI